MAETLKKWEEISRSYRVYIKLEKRLSENTVESYMRDLRQFAHFILRFYDVPPRKVEAPMIERYLALLYDQGREKTSQARALSGIRSFYNYLMLTDVIDSTPTQFIDTPKFGRHLPDILTVEEIDRIVAAVDTSTVKGRRDSAMLEVLYSCGLRVSELTSLRLGDLFFGEGYIRVTGKGDKQRIVPISEDLAKRITAAPGWLFPGRWRGHVEKSYVSRHLTRLLPDGWGPHSLRHRYATRMYETTHDLLLVSKLLGHSSVETTQIYVAMPDSRLRVGLDAVTLAG